MSKTRVNFTWVCALLLGVLVLSASNVIAEDKSNPSELTVARLKYFGGGDWYWGNSALPNLIDFVQRACESGVFGSQGIAFPMVSLSSVVGE